MRNNYKQIKSYCSFILLLIFTASCSKMNETYHDFWDDGQIIYPASPDSLRAFSGRNRIQLQWLNIGDPTLRKAVVYWNNHSDSLTIPIEKGVDINSDTVSVLIDPLAEGAYSFDIYTCDKYGNRSVVANTIGKVYGDTYSKSLLSRLVMNNSFLDDSLHIQWGDPADNTSIGTEVVYTDTEGQERHRIVAPDADTTLILDYDENVSKFFEYRTLFRPDSAAIDTFYTAFDNVRVLGPRTNLSRDGWTATASSFDDRSGASYRPPSLTMDGNIATTWVNQISPQSVYPHTLTIDMAEVRPDIYGISLYVTKRNETPSSMKVFVSDDNTNWQPLGLMAIENVAGWQYFNFAEPMQFRYFQMEFQAPSGNTNNITIYEAAAFTR